MSTSFKDPATIRKTPQAGNPWKVATLALALVSVALGLMLFQEKREPQTMTHATAMHGSQYDLGFINMMIPHHQQAIEEAKTALNEAQHSELKQMARNIVQSQQSEIDQMKQWRKDWYDK